jgi:hypothetical protein
MTMCDNLTLPGFEPTASSESTPSAAASPAKTSRWLARVEVLKESGAAYGESSPVWLASFDPATRSWRTSGLFAAEDSPLYSETLPRSGWMRSGTLFLLPPLVRLIYASGAGSSGLRRPLIPTPTASDANTSGSRNTATSNANFGLSLTDWARGDGGTGRLRPTPQAQDFRNCADYSDGSRGHSPQRRHRGNGQLRPRFVEWMMNYPPGWTDLLGFDTHEPDALKTASD